MNTDNTPTNLININSNQGNSVEKNNNLFTKIEKEENILLGTLLGFLSGSVVMILSGILGYIGILSAFVPFLIALFVVAGYRKGAGSISRKSLLLIVMLIIFWVILSFLFSNYIHNIKFVFNELTAQYGTVFQTSFLQLATNSEMINSYFEYLKSGEIFTDSTRDIMISIVFAFLGTWSALKNLFLSTKVQK